MKKENVVKDKSFSFAVDIITLCRNLVEQKEVVLSKQLLRSGTSIGANIREAEYAESRADFIHKLKIALKEANETIYWIDLLYISKYLSDIQYDFVYPTAKELIRILTSIINTTKNK
jgi:four helix bundle protein